MNRKVGILGGTFDPIHMGHLILAQQAFEQFQLDRVLIMPGGNPPHKKNAGGADAADRAQMVRLAIEGNPAFELSEEDLHTEGYSYTRLLLRRMKEMSPDTDFFFIMGADSLMAFDTWNGPEEICSLCTLAVAVRDSMDTAELEEQIERAEKRYSADIRLLSTPNIDIASHVIRQRVKEGRSIRYYVPDSVRTYIQSQGLYT